MHSLLMSTIYFTVLFSFFLTWTEACDCPDPLHPQNIFCEYKLALVGKILKVTDANPGPNAVIYYTVEVIKRMSGKVPAVGKTFVMKTPTSRCGVRYTVGDVRLILTESDKLITWCSTQVTRPKTDAVYTYIHGNRKDNSYWRNCLCNVINWNGGFGQLNCRLPKKDKKKQCYFDQALCTRRTSNGITICSWKHDEQCK